MSHHHTHDHEGPSGLSTDEKLLRLLEHWIRHNDDHAKNYIDWSAKARNHGLEAVADLLSETAKATEEISKTFEKALQILRSGKEK